jgi:nucleolar protein 56
MKDAVTTWFGAFVVDGARVVASYPFPAQREDLLDRLRARREGRLTPEEMRLLSDHLEHGLRSRDRRLVLHGARAGRFDGPNLDPFAFGIDPSGLRDLILENGEESLRAAWDPSVHVEEAVRALRDLEATRNLIGERLTSWAGRDAPPLEGDLSASAESVARRLVSGPMEGNPPVSRLSPSLQQARRELAELFVSLGRSSKAMEKALEESVPSEAPNVSALLGPLLAARLIAQAGGLDRLAKLPSSTIQMLGAERAFFEHLRGRAPPPRHGLLFLHPEIQGAPRYARGKLARALAGKIAIAARLDRAGRPVRAELAAAFTHRIDEVRALGARRGTAVRRRSGSPPPLHRAAQNR